MKLKKTVGLCLPGPNKTRPGDVLAIPLGGGFNGYARVYRGTFLAVLDLTTTGIEMLERLVGLKTKFFIEFYEPYDVSPWIYLGKWRFDSEKEGWGPPVWFGVPFKYISERGAHRKVSEEEIVGVQKQQLVHPNRIVTMIIEEFDLSIPESKRSRI